MNLYIALLANEAVSQTIMRLRKTIVDKELGNNDPRGNVIPHTTILSFEENISNEKANEISNTLNKLHSCELIQLKITEFVNWDHKVVAMLNRTPIITLKSEIDAMVNETQVKFDTEYKKLYGETIGDHMKLARQIYTRNIESVKLLFKQNMPLQIEFDRIALIKYKFEDKDIIWERNLTN